MKHLILILTLTTLFYSCGTSAKDKSQKFIGAWRGSGDIHYLSIRRAGENFIVRINDEKEIIGSYDSEHDKLVLADLFGEIIIDPASKTLRLGSSQFTQLDDKEHIPN